MKTVIFYNIGQSDIRINDEEKDSFSIKNQESRIKDFKTPTRIAYENFSESKCIIHGEGLCMQQDKKVDFPLLYQTINYMESKGIDFDEIVFFFSDQKGIYSVTDTVYVAELFELFLSKRRPKTNVKKIKIDQNPQDYDLMMKFYARFVEENREQIENNFKNVLVLSPGTPATTFSLIVNFQPFTNIHPIYIPRAGEPKKVDVLGTLVRERYRRMLMDAIRNYDYHSAERILLHSNFKDESLCYVFSALNDRLNFRFDTAWDKLKNYLSKSGDDWIKIENNFAELIKKDSTNAKMIELFNNIDIKFKKGRFIEAVAMIFRLQEAVLLETVSEILETKIEKIDGKFRSFVNAIEDRKDLHNFLRKKKTRYESPNRFVLTRIISCYAENEKKAGLKEKYKMILSFSEKLGKIGEDIHSGDLTNCTLGDLRNASPFGHGYRGINEDDIKSVYGSGSATLLSDLKAFLKVHLKKKPVNFYESINKSMEEKIRLLE